MRETIEIIANFPLFGGLSEQQLQAVGKIAVEKKLRKGEIIFSEGDEGNGFYIIAAGMVKIYKVSPEGKEHILHIYDEGKSFGEVPVFAGDHFPAMAEAITPARVLFFPRSAFQKLLGANPSLAMKMLADLSVKLRQFTVQIENLSLKEIPARLASYLVYTSEEQGGTRQISLPISKGQLASLLGTIPETLSRIFAKLSGQNLIRVDGRKITLLDRAALAALAETGKD
jgi:CRP/FNR family transcriptional regulator